MENPCLLTGVFCVGGNMNENSVIAILIASLTIIFISVGISITYTTTQKAVILEEFREELHKHDLMLIDGRLQKFERSYRKVEE